MPTNKTEPLAIKIIFKETGREYLWPHSHVPRVGDVISMKTGDDHLVKGVTYNLVDNLGVFEAIISVTKRTNAFLYDIAKRVHRTPFFVVVSELACHTVTPERVCESADSKVI